MPCLATGWARAEWREATQKLIENQSGEPLTLVLHGTDLPGVVGVGPYWSGAGEPQADVLLPGPATAGAPAGSRVSYPIAHGEKVGLYMDDSTHKNNFQANFAILDRAGGHVVLFRTQATEPDLYANLVVKHPSRVVNYLDYDPHMIRIKRFGKDRRNSTPALAAAGETKAAGAGAEDLRRYSDPGIKAEAKAPAPALETKAGASSAIRVVLPRPTR